MRELTSSELEMISGGYDDGEDVEVYSGDVVVNGTRYHPPSYQPPYNQPGYYPPTSPPPYGAGGGSTPTPAPTHHTHTSPSGVTINYDGTLTDAQVTMMDKIADYGKSHGYSNEQIWNALQQAYHESRLGANWGDNSTQSKDGTHIGLFQYDQSSFDRWNPNGNIHSNADQIAAIFHEYDTFTRERYQEKVNSGEIPSNLSYDEYLEYKHHQPSGDGGKTVGTDWFTYQSTYDRASYTGPDALKLQRVNVPTGTGSGGGGGGGGGGGSRGGGGGHYNIP